MELCNGDAGPDKILVIDGEADTQRALKIRLQALGYHVFLADNGVDGLNIYRKEQPNFIILEVLLPKLNGYKVCQEIRKKSQIPIIMVTALADLKARIMGLDLGADDYLVKPFSFNELAARIRSVLRRVKRYEFQNPPTQEILSFGPLKIDLNTKQVSKKGVQIKLTVVEFNLLELLVSNSGTPLTRNTILSKIWGYTSKTYGGTRVIDVHISRVRSKIEENPNNPNLILTVRGVGYMFKKVQWST